MRVIRPLYGTIRPERITKPLQLLAAWLVALIILVGMLIWAGMQSNSVSWIPVLYSLTAVGIIPGFVYVIFIMQTKYRPQMQEDIYYNLWLRSLKEDKVSYDDIRRDGD